MIFKAQKKPHITVRLSVLAVRTRLELATPCVTGRYSNQLNYRTKFPTPSDRDTDNSQSKRKLLFPFLKDGKCKYFRI